MVVVLPVWWQAVATVAAAVTLLCAAFTGGFFARAWRREVAPGRRTCAATLVVVAIGDITQAAVTLAERGVLIVAMASLPACAGQLLIALLVLRQMENER
jgi:hypothetical protein